MKKILQTKVSNIDGNCVQAVIASLFDCNDINDVPGFFPDETQSYEIMKFLRYTKGFLNPTYYNNQPDKAPSIFEVAKLDGGINGFFYASVPSQTLMGGGHAVVVDIDLNIVHDPNPNQKALLLKPDDVVQILTVNDWYIDYDGVLIKGENYKEPKL